MSSHEMPVSPVEKKVTLSANDRFKKSFGAVVCCSMILATGVHAATFAFWPEMTAGDVSYSTPEFEAIALPPEIDIPAPPQTIARPAVPVIATGDIDEDITIAPTTFESNPVPDLPPPPTVTHTSVEELAKAPTFTPYTVKPEVKNRDEVIKALEAEYPPLLREAGIGGTVLVWFFIDEEGHVLRTQVHETSGHPQLDGAALDVADIIRFTPALNRDKRVPVWISIPITFHTG
jgi:protein TonB